MSETSSSSGGKGGCGCGGCITLVFFIFMVWAMWYGVPIGDKKWNIDLFPPRIWEMNEVPSAPVADSSVAPVEAETTTDSQTK